VLQDVRFALRVLRRAPGFAAGAVLTLAVGIGADTSIFSVANALLLRPLPYRQPDRLVLIDARRKNDPHLNQGPLSVPRFDQVEQGNRSFSAVAAFTPEVFNLTGRGDPEQIPSGRVSWRFFEVLGVSPAMGRGFRAEEDKAGADLVVMISDALWQRRFGRDAGAIGQTITLDSRDYTIIGVLPAGFRFAFFGPTTDIVAPRVFELNSLNPGMVQAGVGFLNLIARLNSGRDGDRDRPGGGVCAHAADVGAAVSGERDRPGDLHRGPGAVRGGGASGELSAGAARDAHGPGDCAAGGVRHPFADLCCISYN
jgi:hypothetical protein